MRLTREWEECKGRAGSPEPVHHGDTEARRKRRFIGMRDTSLPGRLGENFQLLQLLYNELNQSVDDLVGGARVKGIAGSSPDERAARRGDGVDVAFNLHRFFNHQIIGRVDDGSDGLVVTVKVGVVRKKI